MKKKPLHVLILFSLLFATAFMVSCTKKNGINEIPMVVIDSTETDFEIRIHDWQILGPFLDEKSRLSKGEDMNVYSGLNCDYLKGFGFSEEKIKASDLSTIKKGNYIHTGVLTDNFMNKSVHDTSKNMYFSKYFINTFQSTVYAICEIYSHREQDVVFITGSDDGMKAFLNNKIIINKPLHRSIREYEDITIAHLQKGKNLFFAKVYNDKREWGLIVSLCSFSKAREVLMANNSLKLLEKGIYHEGDSIKFNIALYPAKSQHARLTIYDNMENKIMSKEFGEKDALNIGLSQFPKGIYSAKVEMDSSIFEQWFFYGNNVDSLLPYYVERCKKFNEDQVKINLNALLIRYEHLINPENKKLDDQIWQRKLLLVIKEFEVALYKLENGKQAFRNKLGLHLRGFRSKIDNEEQFYKVYVPRQYKDGKKPLSVVIIVPYITNPIRPFLKSTHVADVSLEEEYTRASEMYGQILLWTNTRGYYFGTPIETSDIFEALEAVKNDYNIDEDRIYLTGTCTGGLAALTLGMRYPSQFAAIGTFSPVTKQRAVKTSFLDIPYEAASLWLEHYCSPRQFANNFTNLPIYIIHGKENHTPTEESLSFIEYCKEAGFNPYFKIIYDEIEPGIFSSNYTVFDFFKGKMRNKNPKTIDFSTSQLKYNNAYWVTINRLINFSEKARIQAEYTKPNLISVKTENIAQFEINLSNMGIDRTKPLVIITNGKNNFKRLVTKDKIIIDVLPVEKQNNILCKNHDIEGPIVHAFSRGFILADCENIISHKSEEMSDPCRSVFNAWKRDYFVEGCRYKKASEISQNDINKLNLVLFGNPGNNIIIKKIINQIPLKFSPDSIILCNKVYRGKNLGIQMIYPNPLNNKNYVVIVGSNNWKDFKIPEMNLSLEGWYDFVIWETTASGSRNILDIGYFDSVWKKLILL